MTTSTFITGQTISGDQAIVALDHVVSVVENTSDEGEPTTMIRLRDQTHLELLMSINRFWDLIPGEPIRARNNPGKRK